VYSSVADPLQPFEDNYRYRNFVFSMADAGYSIANEDPVGQITNGVTGDFDNYFNESNEYPTPLILTEPAK
jgi:hypothetical protein